MSHICAYAIIFTYISVLAAFKASCCKAW